MFTYQGSLNYSFADRGRSLALRAHASEAGVVAGCLGSAVRRQELKTSSAACRFDHFGLLDVLSKTQTNKNPKKHSKKTVFTRLALNKKECILFIFYRWSRAVVINYAFHNNLPCGGNFSTSEKYT